LPQRIRGCLLVAPAVAGLTVIAGCSSGHGTDARRSDPTAIRVTASQCAPGWSPQHAGREHFTVSNATRVTTRVTLIDSVTGGIYGQVWQLGAGTSRPLDIVVPAGKYRWRCVPITGPATVSTAAAVTGKGGKGVRPLMPLSSEEINDAMSEYQTEVQRGINALVPATDRLRAAVRSGDLAVARTRWLTAHLAYERLGAAYGTFGDLDGEINGRPDGLPKGVHDKGFTGFLRVEYGLWHGESATSLRPVVDALDVAVHKLATTFPHQQVVAADIPLRAHEILENTLQFELTGDTDQGSHTNLATARANAIGSLLVLKVLTKQLQQRDPGLQGGATKDLTALAAQFGGYRRGGRWTSLTALSRTERERLDAATGRVLEELALIPNILQMPPSTAPT
jgi:high-affinity iron transporter